MNQINPIGNQQSAQRRRELGSDLDVLRKDAGCPQTGSDAVETTGARQKLRHAVHSGAGVDVLDLL